VGEIVIMLIFGLVGYLMRKFDYDPAVLALAMVLGPMVEKYFRQSMLMYQKGFYIFFQRPISLSFLMIALFILLYPLLWKGRKIPLDGTGGSQGV
jgi:putative tricarboxylic transport membrane protein